MIWAVMGVTLALIGSLAYWRIRRRKRTRLISLVALLREPAAFDSTVLARVAGKAWKVDLGDGASEGADGFVVGVGAMNTIMLHGRMVLINSFPHPYLDDIEKTAERIGDIRIRSHFRQHQAWFSCDAMGVDGTTTSEEIVEWYRLLATLFVEFLDDNCLLVFLPDSGMAYPVNEDTEKALRSSDPLRALQETLTVPIIEVSSDDPLMKQAVESAHQGWPDFVAAYEAKAGENFAVKAPVSHGGNTEFIWLSVTSLEGSRIYGELANEPGNLGPLRLGSKVSVLTSDLNDWCYIDLQGNLNGGFTIEAVRNASRRNQSR